MSVNMIRIKLSELKTFRIVCKKCVKGVIEVPVDNLRSALNTGGTCRFCGHHIMARMTNPDPLDRLGNAIDALLNLDDVLDVEIEVPSPGSTQNCNAI